MKMSLYRLALALALAGRAAAAETAVPTNLLRLSDPDLEVTVWASTPMLKNPTNLDFDPQGRIWVAEGVNYRGHYNRQPAGDRIVILEDSDGDGVADKQSVFVQEPALRALATVLHVGAAEVIALQPGLPDAAVRGGVLRQPAQAHQQRVVARGDALRLGHAGGSSPRQARTGA